MPTTLSSATIRKDAMQTFYTNYDLEKKNAAWVDITWPMKIDDIDEHFYTIQEESGVYLYTGGSRKESPRFIYEYSHSIDQYTATEPYRFKDVAFARRWDRWKNRVRPVIASHARNMANHPDIVIDQVRVKMHTSELSWDGVTFYNDAHPRYDSDGIIRTFSNIVTSTGDDVAAIGDDFENVINTMLSWRSRANHYYHTDPDRYKYRITVPLSLRKVFFDTFKVERLANGADNPTAQKWKDRVEIKTRAGIGGKTWFVDIMGLNARAVPFLLLEEEDEDPWVRVDDSKYADEDKGKIVFDRFFKVTINEPLSSIQVYDAANPPVLLR